MQQDYGITVRVAGLKVPRAQGGAIPRGDRDILDAGMIVCRDAPGEGFVLWFENAPSRMQRTFNSYNADHGRDRKPCSKGDEYALNDYAIAPHDAMIYAPGDRTVPQRKLPPRRKGLPG
jgi:hypothetical protein